jgi:hypothetical protein
MSKNIELIQDLIKQAEQIAYRNGHRDAVEKRAEMLLRKIFGDNTHYLKSLKAIRYSPGIWTSGTPDSASGRDNSTYKKLAVQWLNEALCFVSSSVVADSLVLRNRQLLVAAKRYIGNRIYKFFNNGGVVIVINNDWVAYNEIKFANYESINQALNVRVFIIQEVGETLDSSVITSPKLVHDIKLKQEQSSNGQYLITNLSAVEISDGTYPIFRWEYPDGTNSIGVNPNRMLSNGDIIKLKITNFHPDVIFADNIAGECIIAIGPNNIVAKNNCSFDFNATFTDFSQSQWDVEWTFSDGTKNTNWIFSKQFSSSVTVTLCYINKISKVRCCGSKFLISTSCDCGIKKTRNAELIPEVNGQKWRIQASIWVKAGEVGCEMKYLRKFWVGWLPASNDGVVTDLSGTYKRQLSDKSCLDVSVFGSKALGKGTYPTSISFTQSDIQNIFRETNKLTSGHRVKVNGTWFGFGINGVSRLILD